MNVHCGLVLDYRDKGPSKMHAYLEVAKNDKANKYQRWIIGGSFSEDGGLIRNANERKVLDLNEQSFAYLEDAKNDGKGNKYQQWRFIPVG